MPVGNDVVDLRDPDTRPGASHPRFDSRVFGPAELVRIRAAAAAERVRWTQWAAKESAFKAARKLDADCPFHPREFAVELMEGARATVTHEVGRFNVWFEEARDWIHAVAALADPSEGTPTKPSSAVAVAAEDEGRDPGARVRELARNALAPLLNVDPSRFTIEARGRIPELFLAGRRLGVDLSLSHHGRVVACSWMNVSRGSESVPGA